MTLLLIVSFLVGAAGMYVGIGFLPADRMPDDQADAQEKTTVQQDQASTEITAPYQKVRKAFKTISQRYYRDVDEEKLINGAIKGMVKTLDDPFSAYMNAETAKQFNQSLSSSFQGIGAIVSMVNGKVTIVSPIDGSPAEEAGLRPHDQILKINGKSIKNLSLSEAVLKIRGKKGTTVTLGVHRQGVSHLLEIKVTRDDIPLKTVEHQMFQKGEQSFGYIKISSFSAKTAKEFKKALNTLESKGMDGLVIDVRGNPGGYLNAVLGIGNLIIPDNKPIVRTKGRNGDVKKYFSSLKHKKDYPIVGMINGGSASAAEILAAALKEAGGYELVGTTSFGKGTVQRPFKIGEGELKITIRKWLTPEGHWIHKEGIDPTIKVKQPAYFYARQVRVSQGESFTYNENSDKIANAQVILKGLGYEPGRTDGYYSKQTVQAVKAFQQDHDLNVTGAINADTAHAMDQVIIDHVNNPKYDHQLQKALDVLQKTLS